MPKITLNTIGSRYGSIDALNDNFDAIEQAFENTLSRDGTGPNALLADLDANSSRIINLPAPSFPHEAVTKQYVDDITALLNQYVNEIDIVATNINDVVTAANNIQTITDNAGNIATVAGSISNVNNVGSNISNVLAVDSNETNINIVAGQITPVNNIATVANIASNITTVAGNTNNVNTVASINSEVVAVAGNASNINAVVANAANINSVSANGSNITTVADNIADTTTVATSITNVVAVATNLPPITEVANNIGNVTLVGLELSGGFESGVIYDFGVITDDPIGPSTPTQSSIIIVANNIDDVKDVSLIAQEVVDVAGIKQDVTTVAANIVDIQNAEANANAAIAAKEDAETARDNAQASFDSFDNIYLGEKTADPTVDNSGDPLQTGALYFNTVDNAMKVYNGVVWVAAFVSLSGALIAVNNLSDLANAEAARINLGLGSAATTNSTDYATSTQGSNADTAFGWGDHALAGYLTEIPNGSVTSEKLAATLDYGSIA